MPGSFLDRLLGRVPDPEVKEVIGELAQLGRDRPVLSAPAAMLAELMPGLCEPWPVTVPCLSPADAAARLAGGLPLLRGELLHVDGQAVRQRWAAVCAVVQRHQQTGRVEVLGEAVRRGALDITALTAALFAGRAGEVYARADALGLDAGLTATVLRLTLFPLLVPIAAALAPLRAGQPWERGYCPSCGGWPLLGEFRGLEQTRWLRCGLCASEWPFPRLACPFCGTRDHHQLGYLHVEGEEARHRAATCESCRGYVKMVATLGALLPPRLLLADLTTLHLDLAAAQRGYAVPP